MTDTVPMPGMTEAPVNPYSLLEAVNAGSDTAHTAWLIFVGVMTYLLIAVAGVTHRDLLLDNDIPLPMLQVGIEITRFFLFAPLLLVMFHMGVVTQLVLVARKALELDASLRLLEPGRARSHPLRLELHNFFFVQLIAGPQRSRVMGTLLHVMSWLTIVVLPVLIILYVQAAFLPYHDETITAVHRAALIADILILVTIGIFMMRAETSFFRAFGSTVASNPVSFLATALVLTGVTWFSFFAATIPGEPLDGWGRMLAPVPQDGNEHEKAPVTLRMPFAGLALPLAAFPRNLEVTDMEQPLASEAKGSKRLSLRERDLRHAKLDRSDLSRADLTGADLEGASLEGTKLVGALLGCVAPDRLLVGGDRAAARCTRARSAHMAGADLGGASMVGIDLAGARLPRATLDRSLLSAAVLAGVDLSGASLAGADLSGVVELQGANMLYADLLGANLHGANLIGADLTNAGVQGANLRSSLLYGAALRGADLEGADLRDVRLAGADLTGARLAAADLRGAVVWRTTPPPRASLLDTGDLAAGPPAEAELARAAAGLIAILDVVAREALAAKLAELGDRAKGAAWSAGPDQRRWAGLDSADGEGAETYRTRLTEHLGRLMCSARWGGDSVALGIARRAQDGRFRGDAQAILERLTSSRDCPAVKSLPPALLRSLTTRVEAIRNP